MATTSARKNDDLKLALDGGAPGSQPPPAAVDIQGSGSGMGQINILQDVALNGSLDAVAGGVPKAGTDQPWRKQGLLERNTPPARPGYVQKWMRLYDVEGKPDARNVNDTWDQGWRPRRAETIPADGRAYATATDATFGTVVALRGMVLMERTKELDDYYAGQMRAETDRLTSMIYQDASGDIPSRYGRVSGRSSMRTTVGDRDASGLIDD
jgi:hypothetical protein